jgi:hypothetical protein
MAVEIDSPRGQRRNMPRKRELRNRRDNAIALPEIEREKREAMRAAILANETPEQKAEREAREEEFQREQAKRWTQEFYERQKQEYWSKRGKH